MNAATEAQVRAARPGESSWVSANAGSGKTRVLTDRVARLLLSGADPQKVLCLTYTKAAAAEMQNRLFRTLGAWAMLPDDDLRAALDALGEPGATLPETRLDLARTLFARALETPGGLKIQTIHAFCDSLLRRFPLEAGVAPQFAVLEDRQARALREDVLEDIAEREPAVVESLARHFTGDEPDRLLEDVGRHREAFARDFDAQALASAFGIDPDLSVEDLHDAVMSPGTEDLLAALVPVLGASGPNDVKAAAKIAAALTALDADTRLVLLESVLLTHGGQAPFTAKIGSLPTKAVRASHPILTEGLEALMTRVEQARPKRLAIGALARSAALHGFARSYLAEYDQRKRALGLLDFDDLIARAVLLLGRPETAAWVLWRLDGGLDHILVDEAQDTSPAQWKVVQAISDEFFAGAGARTIDRTIFVVGDEKQSIYSFQGADPAAFGDMKAHFAAMIEGLGAELQRCDLLHSFRSAPPVLALVDAVFSGPAGAGLSAGISHRAIDPAMPGRVELWPFFEKTKAPDESAWDDPVDAPPPDDPVAELAGRIAARIAGWLADGTLLPRKDGDRPIRAGDVMILVQRRGPLFNAVIRALKQAAVPVAGADVLRVGAELAVKDLLAALRVAATPGDDLSLAALLRSPLGGLTETELFDLAHGREGTLWQALRAAPTARCRPALDLVSDLMGQADFLRPFELLERVLIRHDGRRRLVARLGREAEDGIDALLDQALAYESVEAPSVTGFLGWIDRDDVKVKRRTDDAADQVRVMTVHGAKGLESPIVILPDTGDRQEGANPPNVLRLGDGQAIWKSRKDAAPPVEMEAERARRHLVREEQRRLLYVALTRAESWLIVCGAGRLPNDGGDSWYRLVSDAMAGLATERQACPEGELCVLADNWRDGVAASPTKTIAAGPALPDWARLAAAARPDARPRAVSPSGLGGAHALAGAGAAETEAEARARGDALHLLLETLPARPRSDWAALGERLLPGRADLHELLDEAEDVISEPALAGIFDGSALAEVDLSAEVAALGGLRVAGRIDRLVVREDRVLALDFKSNRTVPERPEDVPEGILRQMGAYRAALGAIWTDRRVEVAVIWTRTARVMPLSDALVDAALARAADLDPGGARP